MTDFKSLRKFFNSLSKSEQDEINETAINEGISITEVIKTTLKRKEEERLQQVNDNFFTKHLS